MKVKKLKRTFFQRLMGRPATPLPDNNDFWTLDDGKITVDLEQAPGLGVPGGAVRLEGKIPDRILVVHCEDGQYRAYENKCTHGGRCLDPVPGTATVQCCSIMTSTFDCDGHKLAGAAKGDLKTWPVTVEGNRLFIDTLTPR